MKKLSIFASVSSVAIFLMTGTAWACNNDASNKDCKSTVAHKVQHKKVISKPAHDFQTVPVGGIVPLGSITSQGAVFTVPEPHYYTPLRDGRVEEVPKDMVQYMLNPDGSLRQSAIDGGVFVQYSASAPIPFSPPTSPSQLPGVEAHYFMRTPDGQELSVPQHWANNMLNTDGTLKQSAVDSGVFVRYFANAPSAVDAPSMAGVNQAQGAMLPGTDSSQQPKHVAASEGQHLLSHEPVTAYHPVGASAYRYEDANRIGDASFHLLVVGINDKVK